MNFERRLLSAAAFFLLLISTAPAANSQSEKARFYDIVFEGRGTYTAEATGVGTSFFKTGQQEISIAWKTSYESVMWDEGNDPAEALAAAEPIVSGTLVESGTSTRECTDTPAPYSCQGPVNGCGVAGGIYVWKKLSPGYTFYVDGLASLSACYIGPPCSGCYTAYTSMRGHLQEGAFQATVDVEPDHLRAGKTIYNVSGPKGEVPSCVTDEHPTCTQSFSWTGEVTFTLLRDTFPPLRPTGS